MSSTRVELTNKVVVDLHSCRSRRERLARIHANDYGKRILFLRGKIHQRAAGVGQHDFRSDTRKSDWGALVDVYLDPVGSKSHHAGRLDPCNLLQLLLP